MRRYLRSTSYFIELNRLPLLETKLDLIFFTSNFLPRFISMKESTSEIDLNRVMSSPYFSSKKIVFLSPPLASSDSLLIPPCPIFMSNIHSTNRDLFKLLVLNYKIFMIASVNDVLFSSNLRALRDEIDLSSGISRLI